VATAHVGCCVFSVSCVVVVTSPFSYLTGRNNKIGPAKKADISALITNNASLPRCPQSLRDVQNRHSS
jgi:hypothetical protein